MHILIVTDQHADSLGGVQVSIRLQKRFLERAGHTVTVVAPRMHRQHPGDAGYLDLPSVPVTVDREYSLTLPGRGTDRFIDARIPAHAPVDLVHVQGDFWGALIGYRFAERHGLPVVHTMHNHMEFGIEQVVPFPRLAIRGLLWWQHRVLRKRSTLAPSAWSYLNELALRADAVTAPSGHFARLLEQKGVAPHVEVIWNGVDDEIVEQVLARRVEGEAAGSAEPEPEPEPELAGPAAVVGALVSPRERRPVFLWTGRMSAEKRLMEFLEAVRLADADAEYRLYGGGLLLAKARAFVERAEAAGLRSTVRFIGKVPYADSLAGIRAADALVQTSIGFETQGMTVFEAAAVGTPSIVSDPNIAGELPPGVFRQPRDGSVRALADALVAAAADIRSGSWPTIVPAEAIEFRQSYQTGRMLRLYESVLHSR
jgi:1,2-diacylglycerol 3-alpha-glucosyltransferase